MLDVATTQHLMRHIPWWLARAFQTVREVVKPGPFTRFDRMFPQVEKLYHSPPTVYPSEEAASMPIFYRHRDLQRRVYLTPEDFVTTLTDAYLCPLNNVVLDKSFRIVQESVDVQLVAPVEMNGRAKELPGYWTLLRSPKGRFHYHITIDCLPRLLALNRPPYNELPAINLFCPGPATDYERHMVSLLAPENVEIVEVDPDGLYRPEYLIFTPLKTQVASAFLPPFYASAYRNRILPRRRSTRALRAYISRSKAGYRRIENETQLFEPLKSRGFELVRPEELRPREQIELFYDSEIILGPHGAGLTNVLFADQAHLIELCGTDYIMPNFYFLAKSLGQPHHYLLGNGSDRWAKSYGVDVAATVRMIDGILNN